MSGNDDLLADLRRKADRRQPLNAAESLVVRHANAQALQALASIVNPARSMS